MQRQIKRWEKRIWKAEIVLSLLKNKIYNLGRKKINNTKKKGGHKVVDTDLAARRVGQPEETGHSSAQTPIKIKIKRLASPLRSHAVSQSGHGRNKPLHPTPTHRPDVTCPQEIQEDPTVVDQEMEAMPAGSPFTYNPGTPNFIKGYGTQTADKCVNNPDSTTDNPPTIDTEIINDA